MVTSSNHARKAEDAWRDELLSALVPHVVHRLGNLLTVVMGTADLLAMDESDSNRALELETVSTNARLATEIVRALGQHARSRAGAAEALDLRDLIAEIEPLTLPVVKAAGYQFEHRESAGLTVVRCDAVRLKLLLVGLMVSAAAPRDGFQRRDGLISLRTVELGTRVAIVVSLRIRDGLPVPELAIDPRAWDVVRELGAHLRIRPHPRGDGQSLLLGLPSLA